MNKNILSALLSLGVLQGAQALDKTNPAESVPGEIIVKLKSGVSKDLFKSKSLMGGDVAKELNVSFGNLAVIKVNGLASEESVLRALNEDARIEYAEPNYLYRAGKVEKTSYTQYYTPMNSLTNDPMVSSLWGLKNTGDNEPKSNGSNSSPVGIAGADINAEGAWTVSKGSRDVVIAVVDTGVDYNHPDLKDNMWANEAELNGVAGVDDDGNGIVDDIYGARFENSVGSGNPMDGNGHGTHCSGTIAATHDNGIGVAGVMANARIMAVKFLTDEGSGSTADAVMAIDYATRMGADVMSNSWGGGGASAALEDAIRAANDAGIVFTAAAGNSGTDNDMSPHYPSNYDVPNVISVAAFEYADKLAYFSCYGKRTVHVAAPGRNILSTTPNNNYEVYSGTSMATPHVTGVVGLLIASEGRMNPEALRERLMATSEYGRAYSSKVASQGRVNAYNFLTNTIPDRDIPNDSDWVRASYALESVHPYLSNTNEVYEISVPDARFIRVVIEKYDFEKNYDFLEVIDPKTGDVLQKISGAGDNFVTEYIEGNSLSLRLKTDYSENKWGFKISEIEFIK